MIEVGVEAKRKRVAVSDDPRANYLVIGQFGGSPEQTPNIPVPVDRDILDGVLGRFGVDLGGTTIRDLEDFHPDRLFERMAIFNDARDEPEAPEAPRRHSEPRADLGEILRPSSLLEQITEGGDPFQRYLKELTAAHAATPTKASDPRRIAMLTERMNAVLHHPTFQGIEAAWRGLDFVVRNLDEEVARVYIFQLSRKDLERDLSESGDLKLTRLYQLLRTRRWNAVFGLYGFNEANIELLGRIALLAADARIPFIAEGSTEMGKSWEELRSIPETEYLGLALPRFLLRLPYGAKGSRIESFPFEELTTPPSHAHYLWGNPALACLAAVSQGADPEEGLDLTGLPVHTYQKDGDWEITPGAEIWMTESQARALMEMGLMPLISFRDGGRIRLAGLRAINGNPLPIA